MKLLAPFRRPVQLLAERAILKESPMPALRLGATPHENAGGS